MDNNNSNNAFYEENALAKTMGVVAICTLIGSAIFFFLEIAEGNTTGMIGSIAIFGSSILLLIVSIVIQMIYDIRTNTEHIRKALEKNK